MQSNDIINRFKKLQESEDELNETNMNEIDELINEENNSKRYESEDELDQDIYVDILPTKQQTEEQINDDIKTTEEIMAEAEFYINEIYEKPKPIVNFDKLYTRKTQSEKIKQFVKKYNKVQDLIFFPNYKRPGKKSGTIDWKGPSSRDWPNTKETPDLNKFNYADNIGLLTGKKTGIIVFDVDFKKDTDSNNKFCGMIMWKALKIKYPELDDIKTPIQTSGSGGLHYFFQYEDRFEILPKTKQGDVACIKYKNMEVKFDIISNHGTGSNHIVIEPSVNYDKKTAYKFECDFNDYIDKNNKLKLAPMPDILYEILAAGELDDNLEPKYPEFNENIKVITFDEKNTKEVNETAINFIGELLNTIDERYYDNFKSWIKIGFAVMQSLDNGKIALDLFDKYSKLKNPSKYTGKEDCAEIIKKAYGKKTKNILKWPHLAQLATYSNKKQCDEILEKYNVNNLMSNIDGRFDMDDHFYYDNFVNKYSNCKIGYDKELGEITRGEIIKDLRRWFAFVSKNPEEIITKNNKNEPYQICEFKDFRITMKFQIRLNPDDDKDDDKFEPKYTKLINFKNFIELHLIDIGTFNEISYVPYTEYHLVKENKVFNIWVPYKFRLVPDELYDENKIKGLLDFIKEVWCDNDETRYKYILSWFYKVLFIPHEHTRVSLFVYSPEHGAGKNTLTDFITNHVMGDRSTMEFPGLDNLLGKFNKHIDGRTLVVVNELCSDNPKLDFNKFKSYISDEKIFIEGKNENQDKRKNYLNIISISNHDDSIKFEDRNDRRFACFKINPKYVGNFGYFDNLRKQYFNDECGNMFATYLKNHYDEFKVDVQIIPDTELRQNITQASKQAHQLFLEEIHEDYINKINNNENDGDDFTDEPIEPLIGAMEFYNKYKNWCSNNGYDRPLTNTKFGSYIKSMITKVRKSNGYKYDISTIKTPNMKITKKEN